MSEINYQPIFDYIDEAKKELREEMNDKMATKADIERVLAAIAAFGEQTQNNTEQVATAHYRIDDVEKWVTKVAEKTNIPYQP